MTSRLTQVIDYLELSKRKFEQVIGASNGTISNAIRNDTGLSSKNLSSIVEKFPQIDINWLLTGTGTMLNNRKYPTADDEREQVAMENVAVYRTGAPYYNNPVTAGNDILLDNSIKADSYITIPGVRAKAYFPVIGASMLPIIQSGDLIGINNVNNWDHLDPDNIYMIITTSERMIKHLRRDDDPTKIVCISPNYQEFKLDLDDVKYIYKVVFYGRRP
jgi:phage repressor protein C with HTH and peptisase S24 domain